GDAYVYRHFQNVHDVFGVEVLFQAGVQNTRENALVMLIAQFLYEPGFTQLRTVEQLGYVVGILPRQNAGTIDLVFVIQGPGSVDHALGRIEAFIEKMEVSVVIINGCIVESLKMLL
ncbi:hypothetical protein COOONC_07122, partial [Cooperia oncophora]